jgi:hypothetical protein
MDILWPDARSEAKLAKLYVDLFDNHLNSSWSYSFSTLKGLTGLSKSCLYKVLTSPPAWLKAERINKYEGYNLTIIPEAGLYARAESLLTSTAAKNKKPAQCSFVTASVLKDPSEVVDGERNEYLTNIALTLKHGGIEKCEAREALQRVAEQVPGASYSRNCLSFETIIDSIYKNKPGLFGVKGISSVPVWLLEETQKEIDRIECPTIFKKGIPVGNSLAFVTDIRKSIICDYREREGESLAGTGAVDASEYLPDDSFDSVFYEIFTDSRPKYTKLDFSHRENLKNFSDRHPIDRFDVALNRLLGRYSPSAIFKRLNRVHNEVVVSGHKDKFHGRVKDYLQKGDAFRRVVAAFLIMSFPLQREILSILADN